MHQGNNSMNNPFPAWKLAKAKYSKNRLEINGQQVMQSWEEPYMKVLAEVVTKNGGSILEIGYGMGLSTKYIRNAPIQSHVIIECHPEVIKKAKEELEGYTQLTLLEGFWEDIIPKLPNNSFDGILFDAYPITKELMSQNNPFFPHAYRLLKKGGIFTYYSGATDFVDEHLNLLKSAGFTQVSGKRVAVHPPKSCEYWKDKTILAPIITK